MGSSLYILLKISIQNLIFFSKMGRPVENAQGASLVPGKIVLGFLENSDFPTFFSDFSHPYPETLDFASIIMGKLLLRLHFFFPDAHYPSDPRTGTRARDFFFEKMIDFGLIFWNPKRRATKFREFPRNECVEIFCFRLFREKNVDCGWIDPLSVPFSVPFPSPFRPLSVPFPSPIRVGL